MYICKYVEDTAIFRYDMRIEKIISRLENDSKTVTELHLNNYMKLNEKKCQFVIFGKISDREVYVDIGKVKI